MRWAVPIVAAFTVMAAGPAAADAVQSEWLEVASVDVHSEEACGGRAVTLGLAATARIARPLPENAARVRVRKGREVRSTVLRNDPPAGPSDDAPEAWLRAVHAFVEGRPLDIRVTLCGAFPELAPHVLAWRFEARDHKLRATGTGQVAADDLDIGYEMRPRRVNPRHAVGFLVPARTFAIDIQDLKTGRTAVIHLRPGYRQDTQTEATQ